MSHIATGGLKTDTSGNIIVAGAFQKTIDFDPSSKKRLVTSAGTTSGYILKMTGAGALTWASSFTGAFDSNSNTIGRSFVTDMEIDSSNSIVVIFFDGTVDLDPSAGIRLETADTASGSKRFVAKWRQS